jgi:hypothetical protein
MVHEGFTRQHRLLGSIAAWAVFFLLIAYAITLVLGLLSLGSPDDQIGDPYFSLMEVLIILMAPAMVAVMVAVHAYAPPGARAYSLTALACMTVMAGITSSVHFVILTVSRQIGAALPWASYLFSFEWPSVAYALDILAWDVFFALSMLFAAAVFRAGRLEKTLRALMIAGGALSLAGLIGVPFADMNLRNIGILGYVGISLVIFPLLGILFGRTRQPPEKAG